MNHPEALKALTYRLFEVEEMPGARRSCVLREQDELLRLREPEGTKPEEIAEEVGRSAREALEK